MAAVEQIIQQQEQKQGEQLGGQSSSPGESPVGWARGVQS